MADTFFLQRSPVCDVYVMGMRTNTVALQAAGWELSVERDAGFRGETTLAIYHTECDLVGFSDRCERERLMEQYTRYDSRLYRPTTQYDPSREPPFVIRKLTSRGRTVMVQAPSLRDMWAINARPEMVHDHIRFDDDWVKEIFRPAVSEDKEIIVGPQNVDEALRLILELQRDDQAKLREKAANAPKRVHAQLVSVA